MRRQLLALSCLGGLAALAIPATAQATTEREQCRVIAAAPYLDSQGLVRGAAKRADCDETALLRVRIKAAGPGIDRTLKSGSQRIASGDIVAWTRCSPTPRTYYTVAIDSTGNTHRSQPVRLSCDSVPTPAPTSTATPTPTSSATPTAGPGSDIEDEVVRLTNAARASGGCKPLVHDAKLHKAAEGHSADMAAKGYFDHTGRDGRSPADRIRAAGFSPVSAWGENIAMGQRTAAAVVDGWMNSPGHKANIMNCGFTHIGVGHDAKGPHWTQVFARS
ncbi:CAP domain-containing protein [Nonomuraea longicatena]|uniref:SCP domain-containing protein n=1 Tax=Nonomuraea longicatena TaxID=83682 RepID=A0ABP3ZKM3_9ACTN